MKYSEILSIQIFLAVTIPYLSTLLLMMYIAMNSVKATQNHEEMNSRLQLNEHISSVLRETQRERGLTGLYLGSSCTRDELYHKQLNSTDHAVFLDHDATFPYIVNLLNAVRSLTENTCVYKNWENTDEIFSQYSQLNAWLIDMMYNYKICDEHSLWGMASFTRYLEWMGIEVNIYT